jgi:glycosyltransferase involved in cell wall biosynthesis
MSTKQNSKILLISPSEISKDPRVLAHIEVLKEFGEVISVGYGGQPPWVSRHISINKASKYLPTSVLGLIRVLVGSNLSAAKSTRFSRDVLANTDVEVFELVVANDVHSLAIAHEISQRSKASLWVDMHEYAPLEGEDDWRWRLLLKRYVSAVCREFLKLADCVTTVGEAIRLKYEEDSGREVQLLMNTAEYLPRRVEAEKPERENLTLIHVGVAIRARRLENMIEAVKNLKGVSLDLLLLPTDGAYFNEINERIASVENVKVLSPIATENIAHFISHYDCGIVTIPPTSFNYANALPNKLFQYIQARLAVITGPIPEVARIVNDYGIGWVTRDFSPEEIRITIESARDSGLAGVEQNLDKAALELSRENENQIRKSIIRKLISIQNDREIKDSN